jgi:Fe-S cluster biogenesis protein NfuA
MFQRSLQRLLFTVIPATSTPNPDCRQFRCDRGSSDILPDDKPCDVPYKGQAGAHPLAAVIFDQYEQEVKALFIARRYITITKWSDVEWDPRLERSIGGLVGNYLFQNEPIAALQSGNADTDDDTKILDGDSEVLQCVKELLRTQTRPMVQRDGGDIRLKQFNEATGVVSLIMLGACKSCPSSENTLKHGIERMLKHFIPEVTEVVEVEKAQARKAGGGGPQSAEDRQNQVDKEEAEAMWARENDRVDRMQREKRRRGGGPGRMSLEELFEPEA